jgi:hypothetical protein
MPVRVRILERDFATGVPNLVYRTYSEATSFEVLMSQTQEQTHLRVIEQDQQIAFYPSGGWISAEIIKEKK